MEFDFWIIYSNHLVRLLFMCIDRPTRPTLRIYIDLLMISRKDSFRHPIISTGKSIFPMRNKATSSSQLQWNKIYIFPGHHKFGREQRTSWKGKNSGILTPILWIMGNEVVYYIKITSLVGLVFHYNAQWCIVISIWVIGNTSPVKLPIGPLSTFLHFQYHYGCVCKIIWCFKHNIMYMDRNVYQYSLQPPPPPSPTTTI